jgi:EAL domain-containing protein (putative c-di-GMP-specific phosphodiesterase class I)
VVERIQSELTLPFTLNGHEVMSNVSIGIAMSTPDYTQPAELLRDADIAMYRAKKQGKARYEMFDMEMHAQAMRRLQLETELRIALEQEQLTVVYQPIVALDTGLISGFEALVRWHHPQRGVISPVEFIGVAEETGEIIRLDRWVLREACRQMRDWLQRLHNNIGPRDLPLTINVNLSSRHFSGPDLPEHVERILAETQLDAAHLKLEITESAIMTNADTAAVMLARLRAMGVQLNMDDFGTGYSSLSYLHRFPLDTLKIDRSFITNLDATRQNCEIVKTILTMAQNLQIEVVAEGIETAEQLKQLRELQCHYGQGYFFSKPLSVAEAEALLCNAPKW